MSIADAAIGVCLYACAYALGYGRGWRDCIRDHARSARTVAPAHNDHTTEGLW